LTGSPVGRVNTRPVSIHPAPMATRCSQLTALLRLEGKAPPGWPHTTLSCRRTWSSPASVEVEVAPPQRADLAAPHPGETGNGIERTRGVVDGEVEEPAQILGCPPLLLGRLGRPLRWRRRGLGDVANEQALADGIAQRLGEHRVGVPDRARGGPPAPRRRSVFCRRAWSASRSSAVAPAPICAIRRARSKSHRRPVVTSL
jgi:hypothetical protein